MQRSKANYLAFNKALERLAHLSITPSWVFNNMFRSYILVLVIESYFLFYLTASVLPACQKKWACCVLFTTHTRIIIFWKNCKKCKKTSRQFGRKRECTHPAYFVFLFIRKFLLKNSLIQIKKVCSYQDQVRQLDANTDQWKRMSLLIVLRGADVAVISLRYFQTHTQLSGAMLIIRSRLEWKLILPLMVVVDAFENKLVLVVNAMDNDPMLVLFPFFKY